MAFRSLPREVTWFERPLNPFDTFRALSIPFEPFRYLPEPSKELDGASIVHFGASKVVGDASKVLSQASIDQKNAFRILFGHFHDQISPDFDHTEPSLKAFRALERRFFASKGSPEGFKASEMPFEASLKVSKGAKETARGADLHTNVDKTDANVENFDTTVVEFDTKAAVLNP